MKVNMDSWSVNEIIKHLEIYGDEQDGNIVRVLKVFQECEEDSGGEIESLESEISDLENDVYRLNNEIDDLNEEVEKLNEAK